MATKRIISAWRPIKWFPFIETQLVGYFMQTMPDMPVDLLPYMTEWRWRNPFKRSEASQ